MKSFLFVLILCESKENPKIYCLKISMENILKFFSVGQLQVFHHFGHSNGVQS